MECHFCNCLGRLFWEPWVIWEGARSSTDTRYNMEGPRQPHVKWKKPDTKGHMLGNSINVKCPEEVNP